MIQKIRNRVAFRVHTTAHITGIIRLPLALFRIRHAIAEMKGMEAVKSDIGAIEIEHVRTEDEFDAVHLLEHRTGIRYGLEANPWADTLGYPVDERSLSEYGYEKFVSLVLWEMTWFGYDDRTVQEHVSTWETE